MNEDSPSWGLVLVRIVVGVVLLVAGWTKVSAGIGAEYVEATAPAWAAAPGFARAFGEEVVLKHPGFFAGLVAWGELVLGVAFFLGAFMRPLGLAGAFLFLNGVFVVDAALQPLCWLLLACCAGCAISRAGRRAGADVFLDERAPGWLTW
ncbi:MAG: hypothetical protein RIR65_1835 [Planctomycetota bacterium]